MTNVGDALCLKFHKFKINFQLIKLKSSQILLLLLWLNNNKISWQYFYSRLRLKIFNPFQTEFVIKFYQFFSEYLFTKELIKFEVEV